MEQDIYADKFADKWNIKFFEYSTNRWYYWYGGRSSAGRALDCDSDAS
jgi:hypothetical protein